MPLLPELDPYAKFEAKTNTYSVTVSDKVVSFILPSNKTTTLPFASQCSIQSGTNKKVIADATSSSNVLTIAVQSGDDLIGVTDGASGATLAAGQTATCLGDGALTWTISGGSGSSGVSGTTGFTGASGITGFSGKSGFSGTSGFVGTSGFSGTTGFSGVAGFSGASGASGKSGFTGASGTSGFSGFSGAA